MTIELAPRNKRGLSLRSPIMAGSGAVGYGDCWPPGLDPRQFGAIVTAGVTMRPRPGCEPPRLVELPLGFVLATGDQNPGYRRVIAHYADLWRRLEVPVILSLLGAEPGDRAWMAARLEEDDPGPAGIELPVPEHANLGEVSAFIAAVRRVTTLPLLVKLPSTRAAHLAEACVVAGADALVIGTPPPVVYPTADGTPLEGPLAGPMALPFTLRALRAVAALRLDVPLIASGGILRVDDVRLCLLWGATAVQIRSLIWTDPAAAGRLVAAFQAPSAAAEAEKAPFW
jgi:dihydroorotate dehydrogenase